MTTEITVTAEEAIKIVNKRHNLKHIGYRVFIRPYLPIDGTDGKVFPACALVKVSKAAFIEAIEDACRGLSERGARITMNVPTEDFQSFTIG